MKFNRKIEWNEMSLRKGKGKLRWKLVRRQFFAV